MLKQFSNEPSVSFEKSLSNHSDPQKCAKYANLSKVVSLFVLHTLHSQSPRGARTNSIKQRCGARIGKLIWFGTEKRHELLGFCYRMEKKTKQNWFTQQHKSRVDNLVYRTSSAKQTKQTNKQKKWPLAVINSFMFRARA